MTTIPVKVEQAPGRLAGKRQYSQNPRQEWLEMRVRSGVYNDIPWSIWTEIFEQLAQDLRRKQARNPTHLQMALDLLLEGFIYDLDEWKEVGQFVCPVEERDMNGQPYNIGTIRLPIDPFRQ